MSDKAETHTCPNCGGDDVRNDADRRRHLKGVVYGAAVGDALGVPFEFMHRDTFKCTGMVGEGTHVRPAGTFSDDTSLLIATCDSIRTCGCIDIEDMRMRFREWLYSGAYTADGHVFDVGRATATALERGRGCDGDRSNGNGSLMRIAPLAFTGATDERIEEVSAITHAHRISRKACVMFVHMLTEALDGNFYGVTDAMEDAMPDDRRFAFLKGIQDRPREEVRSTGYVLDTLGAALWCFVNTDSFKGCVLAAVNLGDDSDTTASVAGALAGAYYGYDSIPDEWIEQLRGKDVIEACLF